MTGLAVTDANVKQDFVTDRTVPFPKAPSCVVKAGSATKDKTGAWRLAVPKATVLLGTFTLSDEEAALVSVLLDGTPYFEPADRGTSTVTVVDDPSNGDVRKLTVRDAAGNSFFLDVRTGAFRLTLRSAAGFDPTDGTISLVVRTPRGHATLEIPAKPVGRAGKQMRLVKTAGTIQI